ncbi:Integrase catalytic domain-containing protein [Aphis craccivora]|uniref:Integrase catalytic domain-containing protein n=1 Tax=Aphis craccivora TaxID=307492 RepID=A0A6G0ZE13_APHCR|nr:Integrase catalytic domain-containing protein [Aphis craccivora]
MKLINTNLNRAGSYVNMTYEELNTVVIRIKACLNSRPLYALPFNHSDRVLSTTSNFFRDDSLTC